MSDVSTKLTQAFNRVWGNPKGLKALTIVNHNNIGMRFMITGAVFFLIGGLLGLLIRTQLAQPEQHILNAETYNQIFTMHGTIMMFLFAVPMLEGMAVYLIPKMIGARDLVFPRVSAFSYFCYLFGGLILLSSMLLGIAPNTGWFMYTPLTSSLYSPGRNPDFWLIAVTFIEVSAVATGIELIVTILRCRTDKMALQTMPLYCWTILVMGFMIIFGFPPLILGSILLELERLAHLPFFITGQGGDPILWQHLFWLFGHPDVYILFLPAAGIISTIIPVFARRPMIGYHWIVLAIILTGFISFGLWVHHMFTVGIPQLAQAFFSAASMLVAVPTGIQIFAWIATLMKGRPVYHLPMLWALGFIIIFVLGGLTGVMLASVPFDWQAHDTHFVVAHMHYVLAGSVIFPLIAGLYYWMPLVVGRMPNVYLGRTAFWLTFIGFNLTFLPMHLTGLLGMPRRVYTYDVGLGWEWTNLLSSIGAFIMAIGLFMCLLDFILQFRSGDLAKSNPWEAGTLEWAAQTPPHYYNFISLPPVTSQYPLWDKPDLPQNIQQGKYALSEIAHGRRETLGSDPVSGEAKAVICLPGNTWLPFVLALVLASVCICLLLRIYPAAIVAALISVGVVLRWAWENGGYFLSSDEMKKNNPLLHPHTLDSPGLWGMGMALFADSAFYMSLLFGWLYLWTIAPLRKIPPINPVDWRPILLSGLLLTLAGFLFIRQTKRIKNSRAVSLKRHLWVSALLGVLQCVLLCWAWYHSALHAAQTAHDAILTFILFYLLLHCSLAAIMSAQSALRVSYGYVGKKFPYELIIVKQWWLYTLVIFWISFAAIILLPLSWG